VHIVNHVLIPPHLQALYRTGSAAGTIVDLAVATPDLSTLVTALKAGKLVDTLNGPGPFTVFAPTNEAFAKLPKAVLDHLLEPANIKELDAVLTYHVASGDVHSKDLSDHEKIKTVEGQEVEVFIKDSHVYINNGEVTAADNDASNGVVHIVNHVLIPPHLQALYRTGSAAGTIVDLAVATPDLSTLVTALKAGKLVDTLNGPGPFTVFAPTNEAFAKLPKAVLDHLLEPANIKELDAVLTYHVASGDVHSKDLSDHEKIKTVEGQEVEVFIKDSHVYINNAEVTAADNDASNGVVHIVNNVLIPRQ